MTIQRVTKRRGAIEWHAYSCDEHGAADLPGATTIINKKANPFLSEWFKREGARAALRIADQLPTLMESYTEDSLVKMLASSADKKRDTAGDRGTRIHAAIEHFILKERVSGCTRHDPPCPPDIEDIKSALAGFWTFARAHKPEVVSSEFMVISETERYAATGDLAWRLWPCGDACSHIPPGSGGDLRIDDVKTSKGVYETTALQLAAIRWADHGEDGEPPPQATRFGVIHVRDDGTDLVSFDVRPDTEFRAFLACRDLYEWDRTRSRRVKAA